MQHLQARNKRTAQQRAGPKNESAKKKVWSGGSVAISQKEGRLSHATECRPGKGSPVRIFRVPSLAFYSATLCALRRKCKFLQSADELVCMRRQLLRVPRAFGGGRAFWRDSANRKGSAHLIHIFFYLYFFFEAILDAFERDIFAPTFCEPTGEMRGGELQMEFFREIPEWFAHHILARRIVPRCYSLTVSATIYVPPAQYVPTYVPAPFSFFGHLPSADLYAS